jgi:hypothetical protein
VSRHGRFLEYEDAINDKLMQFPKAKIGCYWFMLSNNHLNNLIDSSL